MLRQLPYAGRDRRLLLPATLTSKFKVSEESVFRKQDSDELRQVVFHVVSPHIPGEESLWRWGEGVVEG